MGPSPRALAAIQEEAAACHRYPDAGAYYLRQALSRTLNLPPEQIICGNGSDEILELISRAFLQPGAEVISASPSFLMYSILTQAAGAVFRPIPLQNYCVDLPAMAAAITPRTKLIIVNNPNNPTGTAYRRRSWEAFLALVPPSVLIVVDEAYIEFVTDPEVPTALEYLRADRPLLGLRTFSKAYGLAGLRIGYGFGPPALISVLDRLRSPFNVNSLAQAAATAALTDQEFLARTRNLVREGLAYFYQELDRLGLFYVPTQTNFLLIKLDRPGREVYERLLRRGVIIRAMDSYGYPDHIRVSVGLPEENRRFISNLREVLALGS